MVLNQDCFRDVILYIQFHTIKETINEKPRMHEVTYYELCNSNELDQYTNDDKHYIITKLFEGKYINGTYIPNNNLDNFHSARISSLTLKGHEMADNISNDTIWNSVKNKFKGAASISLSILAQVVGETAAAYAKKNDWHRISFVADLL